MRFSATAVASASVLALLQFPVAYAALCSIDEMDTINNIDSSSSAPSDCWVVSMLSGGEWNTEVCEEHADCIPYLKTMVDDLPDCSYLGVNVHDAVADAVANCEGETLSGSSNSSSTSSTDVVGSDDATSSSAETGNSASKSIGTIFTMAAIVAASVGLH